MFINVYILLYMFHDKILGCFYNDSNCEFVRKIYGPESRCTACPFSGCVESLRATERDLILKAPTIRQAYAAYDKGTPATKIASTLNIPYNRLNQWLRRRKHIERKLSIYAAA